MFLIDAYAWIEYFRGSEKGNVAKKFIDDPETRILTLESTLAEIRGWALREGKPFDELHIVIRRNSDIVHSTCEEWLRAAELRFEVRKKVEQFGMLDALLIAAKERHDCKIITGDPHFEKIRDVVYLK
jgi:predicted nucleic acid-binding protein